MGLIPNLLADAVANSLEVDGHSQLAVASSVQMLAPRPSRLRARSFQCALRRGPRSRCPLNTPDQGAVRGAWRPGQYRGMECKNERVPADGMSGRARRVVLSAAVHVPDACARRNDDPHGRIAPYLALSRRISKYLTKNYR